MGRAREQVQLSQHQHEKQKGSERIEMRVRTPFIVRKEYKNKVEQQEKLKLEEEKEIPEVSEIVEVERDHDVPSSLIWNVTKILV